MTDEAFFILILFASASALQNKYCHLNCEYGNETILHTVCERESEKCGPGYNCGSDFKAIDMDDDFRQHILDLHNYLRNKVATGNETRGKQPPASNMKIMKYSKELEFIAQCWANTCNGNPLLHDLCRSTQKHGHVGQNLGFVNSSTPDIDLKKSVTELIMYWYDEVEFFDKEWVLNTEDRGPAIKVGHYTQMIWADTSELGCAITYYSSNSGVNKFHHIIFVCDYGPSGNYLGLPVYQIGNPSTNCQDGLKPNKYFRGLCGKTLKVNDMENDIETIFEL